ncbi:hypothetical protein BCR44DRAFT_59256 [Catenaria anguillulae PL171]|uniref:Uncharacterized protein n=1 Tax=Catenaria anguillulae PL171 TaxID=765915 RepID=A0A1Y2HFL0_9FUNG|nr:hypothetical protein BCR44DRAFT_59256 [Catenaria anguillulae PL171]
MVMATKLEFQTLASGKHHMRPSHVRELNEVQYSFRALVCEFANGLKQQSRRASKSNTNSMLKGETRSLAVQSTSVTDALFPRTSPANGPSAATGTRGLVGNTRPMA